MIDREHKQQKSHVLSGNLHVKKQHSKNVKTTRGGSWCHVKDQINFPRRYLNENVSGDRFSSTALTTAAASTTTTTTTTFCPSTDP